MAIGACTGGPQALEAVLCALPADLPVPVVIAQHMPPKFTQMLATRLDGLCAVQVREGVAEDALRRGVAWIAPGGRHMIVQRTPRGLGIGIHDDPPVNSCRPSADVLFESVVSVFGSGVLAVVLSGMGKDGLAGCARVREVGGRALAQDEATSVVWGMPGVVVQAGLAEAVYPMEQMGPQIVRRVYERWPRRALLFRKPSGP